MRITSKGQVTIPQRMREVTGLMPNTEVEFEIDGSGVRIRKARTARRATRGELFVERLASHPERVRMTTDQIMALTRGEE